MIIMVPFYEGLSSSDIVDRRHELQKYIKLAGYGFYRIECRYNGVIIGNDDEAYAIYGDDEPTMLIIVGKLTKKYGAGDFLFIDTDGIAWQYDTNGDSRAIKTKLGPFNRNILYQYLATLGKEGCRLEVERTYHKTQFTTFTGMLHENFKKCILRYDDWYERWGNR